MNPAAGMSAKTSVDYRFDERQKQIRDGAYPLHIALHNREVTVPVIEMLVKAAPEVLLQQDKHGRTPLHVALEENTADDVIATVIECEPLAMLVHETQYGNLPIHTAAASSGVNIHLIKLMVSKWPEMVNERNNAQLTPRELAVQEQNDRPELLQILQTTSSI
jgi:ankyrin repeat protein